VNTLVTHISNLNIYWLRYGRIITSTVTYKWSFSEKFRILYEFLGAHGSVVG
jgi:hypothetical protein